MKIVDVETTILRLSNVRPIGDGLQDVLLVEIQTDEGITGLGEAHTMPEAINAVINAPLSQYAVRGLKSILMGQDPLDIEALRARMRDQCASVLGRRGLVMHAISAIDIALWDLKGKSVGKSIAELLGGPRRDSIQVYASDLMPTKLPELLERAKHLAGLGYRAMKFGWGSLGEDLATDVQAIKAIREVLGAHIDIMIDIGRPMSLDSAIRLSEHLGDLGVYFLEEPLDPDDFDGYANLVEHSPIPIAAGEKETGLSGFVDLVSRANLPIIQPDVARVGGITEAIEIAEMAGARKSTVIPHCWSTDILVSATAQFLSSLAESPYLEVNVMDNPLRRSLALDPLVVTDGQLRVPTAPGLGIELDQDTVEAFRVKG
jgi:L-alanine-DL-glutamate epimerase-like enolase superfamily enzyme